MPYILKEADILKNNLHKVKTKDLNYNPFLEAKVTLEDLNFIKLKYNNVNVPRDLSGNTNRIVYIRSKINF